MASDFQVCDTAADCYFTYDWVPTIDDLCSTGANCLFAPDGGNLTPPEVPDFVRALFDTNEVTLTTSLLAGAAFMTFGDDSLPNESALEAVCTDLGDLDTANASLGSDLIFDCEVGFGEGALYIRLF